MAATRPSAEESAATQQRARARIKESIATHGFAAAFVRLALHDALTFDAATRTGGANASIRMPAELAHRGNEGLPAAVEVLEAIRQAVPGIGYADLIQLAGALGLEALGGPQVPFTAGRRDSKVFPPPGRLPTADKNQESTEQLWRSFRRTGLSDKDALALLGFHPFASSWADVAAAEAGAAEPLRFNNAFYRRLLEGSASGPEANILREPGARAQAQKWADNADLYVEDYAAAWQSASELGLSLPRAQLASAQDTYTTTQVAVAVVAVGVVAVAGWWYGRRRRQARALFQ